MTKQALIYLRAAAGEDGQALLNVQAAACAAYADAYGYKIARAITERGSGMDLNRPGLAELFAAAEVRCRGDETGEAAPLPHAPPVSAVLVFHRDRLARSPAHLAIIETSLLRLGVQLICVADALVREDMSHPQGTQAVAMSLGYQLMQLLAARAPEADRRRAAPAADGILQP